MREAYLGIGTNVGDRMANVAEAIRRINSIEGTNVITTSQLYESAPAHVEDQPMFLNGAVRVNTQLDPVSLMKALQHIEDTMGRDRSQIRYGPRCIDLDILLYGEDAGCSTTVDIKDPPLSIPHSRMHLRPFVLQPLLDISPDLDHPSLSLPLKEHYRDVLGIDQSLTRVLPTKRKLMPLGSRTWVMGIINCTPDSFSDGGQFIEQKAAVEHALRLVYQGADILDVGGQSTRPGAKMITEEEECERVIPLIQALRRDPDFDQIPISIDTFRSSVAREAVGAGADIVNDVSGGTLDEKMLRTVADLGVPYILMHMRGDPGSMQSKQNTTYGNVVSDVCKALERQVEVAEASGICRWNIVVDPGIGFAKTPRQSLELLKDLDQTAPFGLPILSGPSRKSFIAYTLKQREHETKHQSRSAINSSVSSSSITPSSERDSTTTTTSSNNNDNNYMVDELHELAHPRIWGTAAAVTASVAKGADFIRVHDVRAMREVAVVSDAIYRSKVASE